MGVCLVSAGKRRRPTSIRPHAPARWEGKNDINCPGGCGLFRSSGPARGEALPPGKEAQNTVRLTKCMCRPLWPIPDCPLSGAGQQYHRCLQLHTSCNSTVLGDGIAKGGRRAEGVVPTWASSTEAHTARWPNAEGSPPRMARPVPSFFCTGSRDPCDPVGWHHWHVPPAPPPQHRQRFRGRALQYLILDVNKWTQATDLDIWDRGRLSKLGLAPLRDKLKLERATFSRCMWA